MTIKKRAMSADGSKLERRKSPRFTVTVPVEVSWRGPDGKAAKEPAVARQVNGQGGLLDMSSYPELGSRVTLTNFFSAETAEARVLATPHAREGVAHGIIVELIVPSESFWGVSLQVKKAGVELSKLEKCLQAEGIDLRLLREYRDAVDSISTIAQVVRELRERQLDGQEDDDVAASLAAIRVRRTTSHALELVSDLEANRIGAATKGIEELQRALEQSVNRLSSLRKRQIIPEPHVAPRNGISIRVSPVSKPD